MGFVELLFLALALSMDACAVSICKGLSMKQSSIKASCICGAWFGTFQGLMPLIGFFLASLIASTIQNIAPLVAFVLLTLLGINMLKEVFEKDCDCCENQSADLSFKTMFVMAVATSIDASVAGISLAMKENVHIFTAVMLIGVITFFMSAMGVQLGNIFGSRFEKPAQISGGVILILLGTKILLEHLGLLVLPF